MADPEREIFCACPDSPNFPSLSAPFLALPVSAKASASTYNFPSSNSVPTTLTVLVIFVRPCLSKASIFRMSTIARAARPFASRVLSQTLPRSTCVPRFTPVRFPRGSVRSFSQSPFCTEFPLFSIIDSLSWSADSCMASTRD